MLMNRLLSRTRRLGLAASVHTEAKLTELGYTLPTVYVAIAVVALCHWCQVVRPTHLMCFVLGCFTDKMVVYSSMCAGSLFLVLSVALRQRPLRLLRCTPPETHPKDPMYFALAAPMAQPSTPLDICRNRPWAILLPAKLATI